MEPENMANTLITPPPLPSIKRTEEEVPAPAPEPSPKVKKEPQAQAKSGRNIFGIITGIIGIALAGYSIYLTKETTKTKSSITAVQANATADAKNLNLQISNLRSNITALEATVKSNTNDTSRLAITIEKSVLPKLNKVTTNDEELNKLKVANDELTGKLVAVSKVIAEFQAVSQNSESEIKKTITSVQETNSQKFKIFAEILKNQETSLKTLQESIRKIMVARP